MSEPILSKSEKKQMQSVDLKTADIDSLKNMENVIVHTELPKEERIQDYIQ